MEDRTRRLQLQRFVGEWADAERREDVAFLREALTDDFIGIGPLGFMLTKDQWLGRYEGGLSYDSFALEEVAARFYGGAAVATGRQSQAGEFQGNDASGEFRATLIFAEQEGRWLLAGLHLSPIAGAPSFLDR
jgi:ketosteroid isomerase-like protein